MTQRYMVRLETTEQSLDVLPIHILTLHKYLLQQHPLEVNVVDYSLFQLGSPWWELTYQGSNLDALLTTWGSMTQELMPNSCWKVTCTQLIKKQQDSTIEHRQRDLFMPSSMELVQKRLER